MLRRSVVAALVSILIGITSLNGAAITRAAIPNENYTITSSLATKAAADIASFFGPQGTFRKYPAFANSFVVSNTGVPTLAPGLTLAKLANQFKLTARQQTIVSAALNSSSAALNSSSYGAAFSPATPTHTRADTSKLLSYTDESAHSRVFPLLKKVNDVIYVNAKEVRDWFSTISTTCTVVKSIFLIVIGILVVLAIAWPPLAVLAYAAIRVFELVINTSCKVLSLVGGAIKLAITRSKGFYIGFSGGALVYGSY